MDLGAKRTTSAVQHLELKEEVARLTGLEPATPGVTGRYSNQLSYNRVAFRLDEPTGGVKRVLPAKFAKMKNRQNLSQTGPSGTRQLAIATQNGPAWHRVCGRAWDSPAPMRGTPCAICPAAE